MLREYGEENGFEKESAGDEALAIMIETAQTINVIARGKEALHLDQKKEAIDEYIRIYLHIHPETIDFKPSRPQESAAHRSWVMAERQARVADNKILILSEQQDLKLQELLLGRTVIVDEQPFETISSQPSPSEREISGRVVQVSSLLGTLTVRTASSEELQIYTVGEDEVGEPQAQVRLRVIDGV